MEKLQLTVGRFPVLAKLAFPHDHVAFQGQKTVGEKWDHLQDLRRLEAARTITKVVL